MRSMFAAAVLALSIAAAPAHAAFLEDTSEAAPLTGQQFIEFHHTLAMYSQPMGQDTASAAAGCKGDKTCTGIALSQTLNFYFHQAGYNYERTALEYLRLSLSDPAAAHQVERTGIAQMLVMAYAVARDAHFAEAKRHLIAEGVYTAEVMDEIVRLMAQHSGR